MNVVRAVGGICYISIFSPFLSYNQTDSILSPFDNDIEPYKSGWVGLAILCKRGSAAAAWERSSLILRHYGIMQRPQVSYLWYFGIHVFCSRFHLVHDDTLHDFFWHAAAAFTNNSGNSLLWDHKETFAYSENSSCSLQQVSVGS